MADKQGTPPKGRVLTGPQQNIFKTELGGRSDYGGLIISALTGMSQKELVDNLEKRGLSKGEAENLRKDIATGGEVNATLLDAEDQFFRDYLRIHAGPSLIAPPIPPERLERLVSENNALEPCIAAMVTNISCTGYELMPREGTEAELSEDLKTKREHIMDFLNECAPRKSFTRVRKELRRDLHHTGNSYLVVERTGMEDIAFIRRAPSKSMRLIKLDEPVPVIQRVRRNGSIVEIQTMRAERRFVQKIGTKLVYYKEYGSQRDLNRITGEWAPEGTRLPIDKRAHEIIHDKDIEDVRSPYGMPRWITQLPSVLGSRMAEEHNLAFFQSGGVPPVIVFVSGGLVSEEVATALNNYLSGGAKDKQRSVAVEVPSSGSLTEDKAARVQVERFGSQEADSTFEVYDEKNEQRVRRAFRLPGIFLGMADSYNFATAHASYVVAEAQVFLPERDEEDERWNMTIMRELDEDEDFRIASNPLSVQDVNLQLRALQMLATVRGIGVADLVGEISKIAGLEIEVHEDHTDEVIGTTGLTTAGEGGEVEEDRDDDDDEDSDDNGNTPASGGGSGQQSNDGNERPAPGVTSQVRNMANVLAARIARSVREYDDLQDGRDLADLIEMEAAFDDLPPGGQEIVNKALAPVLFNSPFLSDAAMADVAAGYAKAAFHMARQRNKETEDA